MMKYRLLIALCLVSLLTTCGQSEENTETPQNSASEAPNSEASQPEEKIINVHVQKLKAGSFQDRLDMTGQVEPWKEVMISSETGGKLIWMGLKEGQVIGQGALVGRLDTRLLLAQKGQAEANLRLTQAQQKWQKEQVVKQVAQAENQLGSNMTTYQRRKNLFEEQVVSEEQLDGAGTNLLNAKIQLDLQRINNKSTQELTYLQTRVASTSLEVANASLSKAYIYSPISGYVNAVQTEMGEVLNPGAPIAQIIQMNQVKVVAGVPEKDIGKLKLGTLVEVRFDAYPGEVFSGPVIFMGAVADKGSKTFPVKVQLQNPQLKLKAGMIGRLSLVKERIENAIVVPIDTVIERGNERFVFVEKEGRAHKQLVELGPTYRGQVQITSGLKAADRLVVFGHRELFDQNKVKVVIER